MKANVPVKLVRETLAIAKTAVSRSRTDREPSWEVNFPLDTALRALILSPVLM
jgi:hypothetical protein